MPRGVCAVRPRKHFREVSTPYPFAGIGNLDMHFFARIDYPYRDGAVGWSVSDGVLHQVVEHSLNAMGVHRDGGNVLIDFSLEPQMLVRRLRGHALQSVRYEVLNGRGLDVQCEDARIDLRQLEQVSDKVAEVFDLGLYGCEVPRFRVLVGDYSVVDAFDHRANGREGSPKVMGHCPK